jgi:hypothetical protein
MGRVPYRLRPWFSPARNVHLESRLGGGRPDLRLGVLPKLGRRTSRLRRSFFPRCVDPLGCRQKGSEMRVFVASLIVLLVLYFWDRDYNNGNLVDGLDSMRRAISHSMSH